MPLAQKGIAAFSDQMPKVIPPTAHAIADYAIAGGFVFMAALFWKRNRRAAVGSLICAGGQAANALLTDSAGGVTDVVSYRTHAKIDVGLAAVAGAMPNFLEFSSTPESKFFQIMGLAITAVGSLTAFRPRKPWDAVLRRSA